MISINVYQRSILTLCTCKIYFSRCAVVTILHLHLCVCVWGGGGVHMNGGGGG